MVGGGVGDGGVGSIPNDYLLSTQLQLWLFCCWGCGCCWAVTIRASFYDSILNSISVLHLNKSIF